MRILIAEDERLTRLKLHRQLEKMGHDVVDAADGQEAWELFQAEPFPIVISDWEMPNMNGVELVKHIRDSKTENYVYIVMLTGKSDKKDVVAGIEAGADDFVSKPFDRGELRARLNAGLRIVDLEHDLAGANDRLRHELAVARELSDVEHRKHEESLLGTSIPMRALREGIQLYAATDDPLLLSGPPGAGQEAVARAIHRGSVRRSRAFIYVACPHISAANESIYGFQTQGNQEGRSGKTALAAGGTLFLEGVETLSEKAQGELVQFLRESAATRAEGGHLDRDVRVIAHVLGQSDDSGSSGNLGGELIDDLEMILQQNRLSVPSLAERKNDITVIAKKILARRAISAGKALEGLSDKAVEMMLGYSWPGNLQELQSVLERSIMLSSGTLLEIPEELLREGRRVGGYTLQRRLGEGGMGEVWLAQHSLLARPSAVKLIRQSALRRSADSREMLEERFQREADSTSQLRSPNTVELYDFGVTDEGDFFYVMEFLNGVDLHSLVKNFGQLPSARAVYLLKQACVSLGEAHLAGLVHRDVKPENLFVCQLGTQYDFLKLLDFGIVRTSKDAEQTSTSRGTIKGTPSSISPEAAQSKEVTAASDIYSLGCVAYWLLTGRQVFEAPNVMSLLLKHISKAPPPPSEFNPQIPQPLEDLVLRCLAKKPEDRPSDANDLGELLESLTFDPSWDNAAAKQWWIANMPTAEEVAAISDTTTELRPDTKALMETSDFHEADLQKTDETLDARSESLHQTPTNRPQAGAKDWVGRLLGEFKITRLLGQDSKGVMLKARDLSIERDVAIKVLSKAMCDDEVELNRFLTEAKIAGKFTHVNTVTLHKIAREGQLCYLVMEYVRGGNTKEHLNKYGAYSASDATQIMIDACKGLAAAHRTGLVHRDIKPSNLLLTKDGSVKVSDFGLAKQTDNMSRQLTLAGQVIGTPSYMSPEQCESSQVDARSDVYSLGATYYTLLTGARPYENRDPVQVMLSQRDAEPPDPREIRPTVPDVCAQIIEQAMAKRPDQRYQSMGEMLSDLEAIMATVTGIRLN